MNFFCNNYLIYIVYFSLFNIVFCHALMIISIIYQIKYPVIIIFYMRTLQNVDFGFIDTTANNYRKFYYFKRFYIIDRYKS